MPLVTEWTSDTASSNATLNVIHYTTNPIEGNRSLRIEATTGGSASPYACGAVYLANPPYTPGLVLGRVRTLLRLDDVDQDHAGIYCLASQASGITGTGAAYTFGPNASDEIVLQKIETGGLIGTPTTLFSTGITVTSSSLSDITALELVWKANVSIFGGVRFDLYVGELDDFSDLTHVGDFTDSFSPLLTSFAEGVYATTSGLLKNMAVMFDLTRVQSTTID